jgi:hypothetical protein
MREILGLEFHASARGNHIAVSVEQFFRFLNQAVTINTKDRGTNQVLIVSTQCATYAWNSSPIDGTEIIRSVAAVGREFKFSLDIGLQDTPIIQDTDEYAVHSILCLAQANATFSASI